MAILTEAKKMEPNFTLPVVGAAGAFAGVFVGAANGSVLLGILGGAIVLAALTFIAMEVLQPEQEKMVRWGLIGLMLLAGLLLAGLPGAVMGALFGWFFGWFIYWIGWRRYRQQLVPYLTGGQVLWHYTFRVLCGAIFVFLITPILVVLPLSFNAQDFFTFTPEMLRFDPAGYSLKHYRDFLGDEFLTGEHHMWRGIMYGAIVGGVFAALIGFSKERFDLGLITPIAVCALIGLVMGRLWGVDGEWITPLKNSLIIAPIATIIAVSLGTLAAIGLSQSHVPGRQAIMAVLIAPMIVPLIISATGMFFFYAPMGNWLEDSFGFSQNLTGYIKVILAHAVLGIPFVIITVTATLVGFDRSLTRASANMGAGPVRTFFKVQMPLILPGVISGGLFAFITSFDEVVVVLFVGSSNQQTLPWQMFTGLREQISPTILAVAAILVAISIALLATVELLRRRSERLRGLSPG